MRAWIYVLMGVTLASPAWAKDIVPHRASNPNLTIVMDEELILPTATLARAYSKTNYTPLTIVVRNPDTEEEIEQGLEAHLVISADKTLIDSLAAQGLTDLSTIHTFTQSPLALVTSSHSSAQELFTKHISFAAMIYATPKLPVYTNAATSESGTIAAKLTQGYEFSKPLADRLVPLSSRNQVLNALHEKNSLALLPLSDIANEPDIKVLSVLPDNLSTPIRYSVAVLASESMDDARAFAKFLDSKSARELLSKAGLEIPSKP